MAVIRFVASRRLRRRWKSALGIVLFIGLTTGLSLFSIAGSRRTQSSFDQFLGAVDASTMSVTTFQGFDPVRNATVAHLEGVARSRTYVGFNVSVLVAGKPDFSQGFEAVGTFDGRFFDQDRFTATSGRVPDADRPDEVAVNEPAAEQYGYRIGQRLDLGVYSIEQWSDPSFFAAPTPPVRIASVTIVGIGVFPDEVVHDDGDRTQLLLLTPALSRSIAADATYGVQGLTLRDGDAGVDAVRSAASAGLPPGAQEFHAASADAASARRALRPLSTTLLVFGIVVGLVGIVLAGQALARLERSERDEADTLRAFGADPRAIAAASAIPLLAIVCVGVVLGAVLAVLASPLMPIGPVRRLLSGRRIEIDATVSAVGGAMFVLALGAAVAMLTIGGRRGRPGHDPRLARGRRVSRVAGWTLGAGLPVPAVIGVRAAFDRPSSADPVPNRSAIVGTALSVATVVGALTFGASLTMLVHTPRMFGWDWDATVLDGNGYDNLDPIRAASILGGDPAVSDWSGAYFGALSVDGVDVSVLGMDPTSSVTPPIVDGRMIGGDDEIVLGASTAPRLGKRRGDTVEVDDGSGAVRSLRIVGTAIFPAIGRVHTEHVSLGSGAIVVPDLVPGHDFDILGQPADGLGPHVMFVRFAAGTTAATELAHLRVTTAPLAGFAGLEVLAARRPAEIVNADSIGTAPLIMAITLAASAALSLALALGASVRRRSTEMAVLSALGFTRRQLSSSVMWQATSTVVVGLVAGVPGGIVLGRGLWSMFAGQLNVVVDHTLPATVVAVVISALVVGNIAAIAPARAARSLPTSGRGLPVPR